MADQPDMFGGASVGVRDLLQENAGKFRDEFPAWLEENGHVWTRFRQEADKVRARRSHYSARTIIEYLRHESSLTDTDEEYRLNNNHAPDLARLYLLVTPEADGFFSTRVQDHSERTE